MNVMESVLPNFTDDSNEMNDGVHSGNPSIESLGVEQSSRLELDLKNFGHLSRALGFRVPDKNAN